MKATPFIAAAIAAIAFAPGAHADDDAFIQAIRNDGIALDSHEAIIQGHAVCLFLAPANGGSMWDAIQQVKEAESWSTVAATHFVDRSIQNYCPERAP
jgi:hypothetical protein